MNAIAEVKTQQPSAVMSRDVFATSDAFEHAQRVARVFSESNLVPAHFKGKVADCLLAYQIACRLGEDPLTTMQNIYLVSGRPGWVTSYLIARAKRCGVFHGPITWSSSGAGADLVVTAKATIAETGDAVDVSVSMKMAESEGWTRNAKYKTMSEHMLRWRSAAMLIRLYAPEIMLGIPTIEEVETMPKDAPQIAPPKTLSDRLDALVVAAGDHVEVVDAETGEVVEDMNAEAAKE